MNSTIYTFGQFEDGYTQFPNDYAQGILRQGATLTDAPTAMVLHRDGPLMYYSYIRRLETPGRQYYLGFSMVLNGTFIPAVHEMMEMYERLATELVKMGRLIRLNDAGRVVPAIKDLSRDQQHVQRIQAFIAQRMDTLEARQQLLPATSYAMDDTHTERFDKDASEQDIAKAACQGGYVVVTKDAGYDDDQLNSYRAVVARLGRERDELQQKNTELVTSVRRALKKEHRLRRWVFIGLALAVVAWGFSILIKHLEHTQEHLDTAINAIDGQRGRIHDLNGTVESLRMDVESAQQARNKAKQELEEWKQQVAQYMPLIVQDVELANVDEENHIISDYGTPIYARDALYLKPKLNYIGISPADEVHVFVRLYGARGEVLTGFTSPSGYTYQQSIEVLEGENQLTMMGWGSAAHEFTPGSYRMEFWVGHVCLKALDFRLY